MTENAPAIAAIESNTKWPWDTDPLAMIYARVPDFGQLSDSMQKMTTDEGALEGAAVKHCFQNGQLIVSIEAADVRKLIQFAYYFRTFGLSLTLNAPPMGWDDIKTHLLLLDSCVDLITRARFLLKNSMTPERKQTFIELYRGLYCTLRHSSEMQSRIRNLNLSVLNLSGYDPLAGAPAPRLSDLKEGFINLLNDIDIHWRQAKTENAA